MPRKPKILFVGDYCRADYLSLLDASNTFCEFSFLHYTSPSEEETKYYEKYGNAVYWKDFESAYTLLEQVKPDKVVFLYINTYHQVALNIVCKQSGVPAFLLEHGLRADYVAGYDPKISPAPSKGVVASLLQKLKIAKELLPHIRSRLFLLKTIKLMTAEDAAFMKSYIRVRSKHGYLETFRLIKSPKRKAQFYISFSPKIYQIHEQYDYLPPDQKVYYIGIPYFDRFYGIKPAPPQRKLIFIDQPLAEHHLLKWTKAYRISFVEQFVAVCKAHGYSILVKPHPKQEANVWANAKYEDTVRLINNEALLTHMPHARVVVGFYSTYLMLFAAMPHLAVLTLENHPAGMLHLSKPFVEAKVAQPVYRLEELGQLLSDIEGVRKKQQPYKQNFINDWLYKFDGRAGERLRAILLSENFSTIA